MPEPEPSREEVWLVDFGMAAKVRPALVVSTPYTDRDRALIAVVPHTTSLRRSELEIVVELPFLKKRGAFLIQGFATVPPPYFLRRLGKLHQDQMILVEDSLKRWLQL